MSSSIQPTDLHLVLTNHSALLEHVMVEQLGPVAALITRTLGRNGPLSLRDAITAIQQDPFLTAQIHQDSSTRLIPHGGVQGGHAMDTSTPPPSTAVTTAPSGKASGEVGAAGASATSPAPPSGARHAPLLNATAAYVRAARETPSNLFLDLATDARADSSSHPAAEASAAVVHALVHDPSLLTDAAVKETMARLVLHRVVRYDATSRRYELMLGYGILLRVLFPLVARLARRQFGAAGEAIVLVLHKLGVVPSWSAVLQLAFESGCQRQMGTSLNSPSTTQTATTDINGTAPSLQDIRRAGARLWHAGWVQLLYAMDSEDGSTTRVETQRSSAVMTGDSTGTSSSRKRPRDVSDAVDESGSATAQHEQPCRLCLQTILCELYKDAVQQLMGEYYGSHLVMPSAIVGALVEHALPSHADRHPRRHAHPYPHQFEMATEDVDGHQIVYGDDVIATVLFPNADDLTRAAVRPGGFPPAPAPSDKHARGTEARQLRALGPSLTVAEITSDVAHQLALSDPVAGDDCAVRVALTHDDEAALRRTLRRLSEHTPAAVRGPLIAATTSAPSQTHHHVHSAASMPSPGYALALGPTSDALKAMACESVIFARHGVLGVRLWKLLTAYHALEDRTLAEECMSTQAKTREALHALMKDGYIAQREVPRSATQASIWAAERVPRAFIFLWTTSMDHQVVPVVREQVAKSLHHALTKLSQVYATRGSGFDGLQATTSPSPSADMAAVMQHPSEGYVRSGTATVTASTTSPQLAEALRSQRVLVGLQACALSLMQQLLVLDFF